MSTKELAFRKELFALMRKYSAIILCDDVYYEGESENVRFKITGEPSCLDIKDIADAYEKQFRCDDCSPAFGCWNAAHPCQKTPPTRTGV